MTTNMNIIFRLFLDKFIFQKITMYFSKKYAVMLGNWFGKKSIRFSDKIQDASENI